MISKRLAHPRSPVRRSTKLVAIAKRIRQHTGGVVTFDVAALYPVLYSMETRGWVQAHWEETASGRRRRCYRLTTDGRRRLQPLRREWREFFRALNRLARLSDA
jgi:PadR family transcriptional regulator, regulatory protein PadR